MELRIEHFIHLKQIVLRKVNLNKNDMQTLANITIRAPTLRELDISNNNLNANDLSLFLN